MKRIGSRYLLIFLFMFFFSLNNVMAATIRETLIRGDGYDTIEPGTFIIGITKFPGTEVITAAKASVAGANDAMFYAMKNGTTKGYEAPSIYYYVDANVGWFVFDSNNNAFPVTDDETLKKLSNLDIYYVSNVEKRIKVSYSIDNLNLDSLGDGLEVSNNELYVDATKLKFDLETLDGKTISFVKNDTTSDYVRDDSSCYEVTDGVIINYDSSCGSNVIIPGEINGEIILGIGDNAFNNKNLESVVIPSSVKSIGSNSFANNNLNNVTFDDKYDTTDFLSYSNDAFDSGVVVNYDNDLTRALNSLPDKYTLKVYSGLDLSQYNTEILIRNAVIKEINTEKYNFHVDSSEIYKYYNLHYYLSGTTGSGECYDNIGSSFSIFFAVNSNGRYSIFFQKITDNCTRRVTVDKEITLTYEKVGNLVDKLSVENAFNNMQKANDLVSEQVVNNSSVVTRRKYLEDFIDNNRLDYLYDSKSDKIIDPTEDDDEIGGSLSSGDLFLFKNDILYQVVEKVSIVNVSNAYFPKISSKDYDDTDTFINDVLNSFKAKTNVTNYNIITLDGDRTYNEMVSGANKVIYLSLFNLDTLEYWSIFSKTLIESTYDESGYSGENCFEIDDGTITKYDGECGADVKIPNTINNQTVKKIGDYVFHNYSLRSVTLPDTLEIVGNGAFYVNDLKTIYFPNSITEIGTDAFAKNKLESINIPDTVRIIGDGAFTDNQLADDKAFIYGREYDGNTVNINNTIINSYAGKNRDNITIPGYVKRIGAKAFEGLGIDDIVIPYGIKSIGYYAFEGNNISSISIPDSIESLDWGVFVNNKFSGEDCFIYLRNENNQIDYSTLVNYSFYVPDGSYNYEIDRLEIPSTVKKIWSNAFGNSYGLYTDELVIPYGVEEIGDNAFSSIYFKNSVTLPKSVTKMGVNIFPSSYGLNKNNLFVYAKNEDGSVDNTVLMAYIGDGYENGQKITLPSEIKEIRSNVFNNKYMREVVLNNGLEVIGSNAFANSFYLNEINFPSSLRKVKKEAFLNSSLNIITLNEGLEEIESNAFNVSNQLNSISIPSSVRKVGDYAFGYVNNVRIYGKSSVNEFEDGFYLSNYPDVNIEFINE